MHSAEYLETVTKSYEHTELYVIPKHMRIFF
jgi:hypothetical protein